MGSWKTSGGFVVVAVLAGCGSVVVQSRPEADGGTGDTGVTPAPDRPSPSDTLPPMPLPDRPSADVPPSMDAGRTCTTTADCDGGLECYGGEGCAVPWSCQPALGRACTDDLAAFCGCDGRTFRGSSTCPAQPFTHRGPCEMPPPPPPDAGPGGCALGDGRECAVGTMCLVGDCTTCYCAAPGALRCTGGCVDAGPTDTGTSLRTCRSSRDCPRGDLCIGEQGCGVPWTCRNIVEIGGCTTDFVPFCGCDGQTFHGSSRCPGQPYQNRGGCGPVAVDAGSPGPRCAAQDARGEGNCDAFFGYVWNGTSCVGLGGCRCVGVDCRGLPFDPMTCENNHRACPRR